MRLSHLFGLPLALAPVVFAAPERFIEERHIIIEKRQQQANVSELLELATIAGITALPTDPAVLLALGPLAQSLAAALPTSPVLSALLTAAPPGFISSIVNDPSYASSFESAFSAGSSPSWFNALPTSVKKYLHTYSGFAAVGSLGAEVGMVTAMVEGSESAASSKVKGGASNVVTTTVDSSSSTPVSSSLSAAGAGSETGTVGTASSSSAKGEGARATGVLAVGVLGAMGVLGVAVAL